LHGDSPDARVETAVEELQPLPDVIDDQDKYPEEFEARVREIVREEINQ
jgi:hypothetical protein